MRLRRNNSIAEGVVGGAAVGFVPPGGKFVTKAERQSEVGTQTNHIFRVECPENGAPVQRGRLGIIKEAIHRAAQELRETRKGGLPVLAESDVFVRLKLLKPRAEAELVAAAREGDAIFIGINVARDVQIAAVIASGQTELSRRIGSGTATHNQRTGTCPRPSASDNAIGFSTCTCLPAWPIAAWGLDAALPPTTAAPTGNPARKPGTLAAGVPGVGSPAKK